MNESGEGTPINEISPQKRRNFATKGFELAPAFSTL